MSWLAIAFYSLLFGPKRSKRQKVAELLPNPLDEARIEALRNAQAPQMRGPRLKWVAISRKDGKTNTLSDSKANRLNLVFTRLPYWDVTFHPGTIFPGH